uniref:Copper homeostasis protein cutC homolog n=1 Tax=Lygus hesperus TaxID=30085 RepID=A0A0K8TDL3_LYGHE
MQGGDFVYSDEEIQIMLEDIRHLKDNGADGFVLGVLNENRDVDYEKCKVLVDACSPFPVTFHRAFDEVVNPKENFQTVVNLGCSRLLTSGCEPTAVEGASLIRELVNEGKITVMPGSGITVDNVGQILRCTGAKEFHGSAKVKVEKNGHFRSVTDDKLVIEMTEIYKKIVFCQQCLSCDCEHRCL